MSVETCRSTCWDTLIKQNTLQEHSNWYCCWSSLHAHHTLIVWLNVYVSLQPFRNGTLQLFSGRGRWISPLLLTVFVMVRRTLFHHSLCELLCYIFAYVCVYVCENQWPWLKITLITVISVRVAIKVRFGPVQVQHRVACLAASVDYHSAPASIVDMFS